MKPFRRNAGPPAGSSPPIGESPLLDVDRLTVRFGGLVAVSELDLDVPAGSIVSLIGPNGAGKTTAFNTISGIYSPTSGSVRFRGRRLERAFTAGTFWSAMGVGLLTGLLFAAAAVDIDLAYAHFFPGSFVNATGASPQSDFVQIAGTLRF